jgi:hypothetical protein
MKRLTSSELTVSPACTRSVERGHRATAACRRCDDYKGVDIVDWIEQVFLLGLFFSLLLSYS